MADDADLSESRSAPLLDAAVADIRRKAADIPQGTDGECVMCGVFYGRLVHGVCCRCRDRHRLS